MELKLEGVSKTYPNGVRALTDVTLTIPRGMYGLLGPNGAGKSTLMRSVATLQEVDAGTITFNGIDVRKDKERLRDLLGYLPQDFGVYPKVTAWDMLDHLAQLKGIAKRGPRHDVVKALLTKTNLWDHRFHRLGGYSGGMKQRFGIAQALLGDPKLIIVDEPTAGLDPAERFRFHNLLAEISEDVVVLLSTHIVGDVADLCQSMAILASGKVILNGHPLELMKQLDGKLWKKFVSGGELEEVGKALPVIAVRRVAGKRLVHVYAESAPEGFSPVEPDLEDVYFRALWQAQAPQKAA
ncbi:MAG: ABC transporter ATP-binding protein [Myxococcota bacterium]